jgi:hypothetical protein
MHVIEFMTGIVVVAGLILFALTMLCRNEPSEKPRPRRNPTANWQ